MAICTFGARTLASEACIEDLIMQARKIKYDFIGHTETRRQTPLHAVFKTGMRCRCPRQYALGHEHRFIRKLNNQNWTFAIKKMWLNPSFNHLRCLLTNIEL
ncbi:unnamed protein product [Haemonchus placei]|uniref:Protein-serine/threonine phosphatase n=1 Tax=Haemonchus placei TaxID=6290 RepID=A0A0N4VS19_HAEPC|nr:unnamed protein product [Haemonchus placei]